MNCDDVIRIYLELNRLGVQIWIDGGWAVDALLSEQTRPHDDLDIAIERKDVTRLCVFLETKGYRDKPTPDTCEWNFVLSDQKGNEIDVHVVSFDEAGNGYLGPKENNNVYPLGSLTGKGTIDGVTVDCIDAFHLVQFHTGYDLRAKDRADVKLLCDRFDISLPQDHRDQQTN